MSPVSVSALLKRGVDADASATSFRIYQNNVRDDPQRPPEAAGELRPETKRPGTHNQRGSKHCIELLPRERDRRASHVRTVKQVQCNPIHEYILVACLREQQIETGCEHRTEGTRRRD